VSIQRRTTSSKSRVSGLGCLGVDGADQVRVVKEGVSPSVWRQPVRKCPTSPTISVPNTDEESSGSGGQKRPAAKKARSNTAVGGPAVSCPRPRPKARPKVVMVTRRALATFDLVCDMQQLREEVLVAFTMLIGRWEGMAWANVLQGKGRGKERAL
jgi:hypothetical protein